MDDCEKIIKHVKFLEDNDFEEKYLSDILDLNKKTFKTLNAYFLTKRFQEDDNSLLAERLDFVVGEMKKDSEISSFRLVHEVFKRWPPEDR